MSSETAAQKAREYFPRGLVQPESGYRFSIDSLLLAAFARGAGPNILDIGCGCGVVGLAMLLDVPDLSVTGLDSSPEMIGCAKANTSRLGFGESYRAIEGDVREVIESRPFGPECFDAAVCNPPYREIGRGRVPEGAKLTARFEAGADIGDFMRAAAFGLKNKGRLFVVFLPERLAALFPALETAGLAPKRIRFAHGKTTEPAKTVLVEARKNGGPGLVVDPPLILYAGGILTCQALDFCSRLECNNTGVS